MEPLKHVQVKIEDDAISNQDGLTPKSGRQQPHYYEEPAAYYPNLGSNTGALIRHDILEDKARSRSVSPNQRDSDMSIGASLNPNLRKAKEDRIAIQNAFLNGEEDNKSSDEEAGATGSPSRNNHTKTAVMHFKRKGKTSGAVGSGLSAYNKKQRSVEIDTDKMYDHYMEESKGITVKAEGERDRLARLLDMTKQIRTYDLKRIRNQELEELNLNLTGLKTDWSGIKSSL